MANERKTVVTYIGNGKQKTFSFHFDYLSKSFVKVRLIGLTEITKLTYGTDYTVTNKEVTFVKAPSGTFQIYRETPTDRLVVWEDASVLRSSDLTLFEVQLLHIAEETMDKVQDGGLAKDPTDGKWDARLAVLKNLLDPTDPQDAVTKSYVESVRVGIFQARDTAVDAKDTAVAKASEASASASSASNSASIATIKANEAANSASQAANSASQAANSASVATDKASIATTKANEAANSASVATDKASIATSEANRAKTEADRAKTEADRAASIANAEASIVKFTPSGNISATNVQAAIAELDAEKVNVSDVVTTATANKILKLNSNAKLPASITGDAATVGGKAPGTGANQLLVLDENGKVPIENIPIGKPLLIAVIGDSLSAHDILMNNSWPSQFENIVNKLGGNIRVINLAFDSATAYRVLNPNVTGQVDIISKLQDAKPDVVICALGTNDCLTSVDNRTIDQVKSDIASLYQKIKSVVPNAKLVHCNVTHHDAAYANPSSLYNKNVIPYFWQLASSGILANSYTPEVKNYGIISPNQTKFNNLMAWQTYAQSLLYVDYVIKIDYWRIARLGLLLPDLLHPSRLAKTFMAGYVLKGLTNVGILTNLVKNPYQPWQDPDNLFNTLMTYSSGDYNFNFQAMPAAVGFAEADVIKLRPDAWFYPSRAFLSAPANNSRFRLGETFIWQIFNGFPNTPCYVSVNGGAFNLSGYTNDAGNYTAIAVNALSQGSYTLRYKMGNEIYGPLTYTFP